jgi:2-methylcitrate dehydratase PrpD
LQEDKIAQAITLCEPSNNALPVTRTELLWHGEALASANTAFNGTHAPCLARAGITGPIDVLEGNRGSTVGPFSIEWHCEKLDAFSCTALNTRQMSWDAVAKNFRHLASRHASPTLQNAIIEAVDQLQRLPLKRLTHLLSMTRSQIDLLSPWTRDAS